MADAKITALASIAETAPSVAASPLSGYVVHPAFVKDGVEVPARLLGVNCG
jgi:hypothetical protein